MPTYEITDPSGAKYDVTAPDGATQEQVLAYARQNFAKAQPAQPAAPQRSAGEDIARQIGLTARSAATGIAGLGTMAGDALFGLFGQPGRTSQALQSVLDTLGLPRPESATERVSGHVASALAGMGGTAAMAGLPVQIAGRTMALPSALSQVANPQSMGQAVATGLTSNMGAQTAATGAGSLAGSLVGEAGGGPGSQIAASLLAGVAAPMGMQAAANAVSPQRILSRSLAKSEQTPFAQEGERLAQTTGMDLTPGARTGNRFQTAMENTARQSSLTADRVQGVDMKIANQAIQRVEQIADRIGTAQNPETLGNNIRATIQRAARALDETRNSQAAKDYGLVRQIAGDGKVIRLQTFADELAGIVDDYKNVAGADAQKVVSQASAALRRITGTIEPGNPTRDIVTPTGGRIRLYGEAPVTGTLDNTISEAMRTRSFYGKAARGSANVFEDIAPDLQRTLSARLFGAINKDFDAAAEAAGGPLKQALTDANANFRKNSQSIEFLEKSALGRMIGEDLVDAALSGKTVNTTPGEAITAKLDNMHPSVRQESLEIIGRTNPALAASVRANFLREALEQGKALPPSMKGSSQAPISFNRFVSALGSQDKGFERTMRSYGFTPAEISDIRDVANAMMRQGDTTGRNFSGTEAMRQNTEILDAVGDTAKAAATGGLSGLVRSGIGASMKIAGRRIGMERIVDSMASQEGRNALRVLSSPKSSPQAVIEAFATVDTPKKQE